MSTDSDHLPSTEITTVDGDWDIEDEPYDPPCGDPDCEDYHCGSCDAHTGQMGHFAAFCQLTQASSAHHFCCPDDCELTSSPDDPPTAQG